MDVKILTWNVSFLGLAGMRREGVRHKYYANSVDRDNDRTSFHHTLPCSQNNQKSLCLENVHRLLTELDPGCDLICLTEPTSQLARLMKAETRKTILRFIKNGPHEIVLLCVNSEYVIRSCRTYMLHSQKSPRPMAIVVFERPKVVLIIVHLFHFQSSIRLLSLGLSRLIRGLDSHNVIITGDFNTELPFPGRWDNHRTGKTCFTIVSERYRDERPMSFMYDRFVTTPSIDTARVRVVERPEELLTGTFSDHLPVLGDFVVSDQGPSPDLHPGSFDVEGIRFEYVPNGVEFLSEKGPWLNFPENPGGELTVSEIAEGISGSGPPTETVSEKPFTGGYGYKHLKYKHKYLRLLRIIPQLI